MGTFKIVGSGFFTASRKARLAIYLWLANFLFSLVLVAPFYFLLQRDLARSLAGENLFKGQDLLWLGDLVYKYQDVLPLFLGWLALPSLFYLVLQVFLNGGVLGRISVGERVNLAAFLSDSARYFWRFFRVFLISIIGYVLVFGLLGRGLSAFFKIWTESASTQWTPLIASFLRLFIFLLLFSIVKMFFDYVKVGLVVEESKKTVRATLANFQFLGRRFFRAWGLFLLVGLMFIGLSIGYYLGARLIPKNSISPLVILFIWQQVYILARSWTTVLFFSTEYEFFKTHKYSAS
ncbi:MAG: hypothetical protein QHH14_01750 [Clostridiales bacterium]|nr:hypothetical protein [Clostridiales bacterium]